MKVHEIMTVDPICCTQAETAELAAKRMKEHNVGVIPVVESEKSYRVVGIITDRDLCLAVIADGKDPRTLKLEDCMQEALIYCGPGDDLEIAIKLMQEKQVRRLPVLDGDSKIQGILSTADLTLYSDLSSELVEQTFRDISRESEELHKDRDTFGAIYIAPGTGSGACL